MDSRAGRSVVVLLGPCLRRCPGQPMANRGDPARHVQGESNGPALAQALQVLLRFREPAVDIAVSLIEGTSILRRAATELALALE
jgi:hypothetical protein